MANIALAIIDMQKAYFRNAALEAVRQGLTDYCNALIEGAANQGIPVFHVVTEHKKDGSTWTLNMLEDGQGYLLEGDEDAAYVDGLRVEDTIRITKTRDSAFHGTPLAHMLQGGGTDTVILAGVSTHTCVFQTAADAYANDFHVWIARDAVATHDPRFHDSALELLEQEYRQKTYTNEELIHLMTRVL